MGEDTKPAYDIRTILHEMREEYWKGLAEVEEQLDEEIECVVFDLGGEWYAFETIYAAEIIKIPRLVRVPRVQEIIAGVFNLRGEITAALDIRPLLGLPTNPVTDTGRLLIVKGDGFITGIIAEKIQGVTSLSFSTFEPVVKSINDAHREFLRGQVRHEGNLVILLDIVKLMAADKIRH